VPLIGSPVPILYLLALTPAPKSEHNPGTLPKLPVSHHGGVRTVMQNISLSLALLARPLTQESRRYNARPATCPRFVMRIASEGQPRKGVEIDEIRGEFPSRVG
jgi:hypothetical protein